MGVYLREKKVGNGKVSYYLDIYHNKRRWYEFLKVTVSKTHPTEQDKEKKRLVQEIRIKRENELIVQDNGLIDKYRTRDHTGIFSLNLAHRYTCIPEK